MGLSIQWVDSQTAKATFVGNVPSIDDLGDAAKFSVISVSGDSITVYESLPTEVAGVTILKIGPSVVPGATYIIRVRFSLDESITTVPQNIVAADSPEWAHGLFDTITQAFGECVQRLSGKPQTLVVSNFRAGDTDLYVESTLGFPASGAFFAGGQRYLYSGIEVMKFKGVEPDQFYVRGLRKKVLVTLDVNSILPV